MRLILLTVFSVLPVAAQSNAEYVRGREAEKSGDVAKATANYQAIVSRDSILKEYALWRLARLARATGDLPLERERLRQLLATAPSSLLAETATLRLAESFFESGDFTSAAQSAKTLTTSKNTSLSRQAALLTGQALARADKPEEARVVFNNLISTMDASRPDDFALAAVRELDQAGGDAGLPEAQRVIRASIYQFNRDFAGARRHYQAIADQPQNTTVASALFQIARGLYLETKYDEAVKAFQKVVDTYPDSTSAREAQSFLGSTYLRMKRYDDAIAAYKRFIERFPDAPNPERPYLNMIDVYHEAGRHNEALNLVQQTRSRFGNDIGGTLALFAQLRIHLAQANWPAVVRDAEELSKFSDLGGTRVPGGTNTAEITFLRAYALEQSGRTEEAIAAYLSIPDGRNEYYGMRATQRLLAVSAAEKSRTLVQMQLNSLLNQARTGQTDQARVAAQSALRLTNDAKTRSDILKQLQAAYDALPAYRLPKFKQVPLSISKDPETLSDTLLSLELYDEALPEFLARRGAVAPTPDESYTIAMLSLRAGLANRAVRFAEQVWKTVPADYVLELAPRDLLELFYPVPFRDSLLKHATSRNVDPRFVLAIARQESRFQADAKSIAAARGMMQFIVSTANTIASELKLEKFNQDDLYNADTAILFGSQYLSNLFKLFPDQPQAVAGSYNGGEDNLARWIARSRSNEADRYVPEIGFTQTKDYVYKVLPNYWNYQRLYDAQLQPQSPANK
ncbi:MAG TPA: transglycosylase SLT domain-containing protein [Pyrinomonadaceae bacterium]|nr:transglycosylase SLT domain-containing protein [Pyrinomonadaceae bacterium]